MTLSKSDMYHVLSVVMLSIDMLSAVLTSVMLTVVAPIKQGSTLELTVQHHR
jgi:hypothetical protein